MIIKCGRYEYDIIRNYTILDNGACIQILGRTSLNCKGLMMSRKTFNNLLKQGYLELVKEEQGWVIGGLKYYKIKDGAICK